MPYRGYTEKQKEATDRYKRKSYKRVPLDMPITEYAALKEHTEQTGESVNGFIRRIIKENIGGNENDRS